MTAREWLRRRLAAYAYPELGRLDQALTAEQQHSDRLTEQVTDTRGVMDAWRKRALTAEGQLAAERKARAELERALGLKVAELAEARRVLGAMASAPDPDQARRDWVKRTGGR